MKQPHEMTREEFLKSFPTFTELSPRAKWRCFHVNNKANFQETGEEVTWKEFVEFATSEPFRWVTDDMSLLVDETHEYFIRQALQHGWDIPSDVLAEYPDLVEEYITARMASKRAQQRRSERFAREKEDRKFWKQF